MTIALLDGRRVRVSSVEVAAVWLRNACHCSDCRRPATNERRLDPTTIDLELRVLGLGVEDEVLVGRTSDGHMLRVPLAHLELVRDAHHLDRTDVSGPCTPSARNPDASAPPQVDRVPFGRLDGSVGEIVAAFAADGAVVIEGVEPTDEALRRVAERLGEIEASNYGDTWSIDAVVDPVSEVESDRALLVHTDLPYLGEPPSVQLLLACVTDVAGGASTLVDGHARAHRLRVDDPEAFGLLTAVHDEYPYQRPDVQIVGRAPTIELGDDGAVRVVRRAPDLVGSPIVAADDAADHLRALRRWWSLLDDPMATATVALRPGDLLVFDNHRMLHGRTGFDLGASGRRVLRGCYVRMSVGARS